MARLTLLLFTAIFAVAAEAQERSRLKDITDNKEHWLFEFEMGSSKILGTADDVHAINAVCLGEARRDSHFTPIESMLTHWMSPSQTVTKLTYVDSVKGALLFVAEKRSKDWFVVHQYHVPKYAPKHVVTPQT